MRCRNEGHLCQEQRERLTCRPCQRAPNASPSPLHRQGVLPARLSFLAAMLSGPAPESAGGQDLMQCVKRAAHAADSSPDPHVVLHMPCAEGKAIVGRQSPRLHCWFSTPLHRFLPQEPPASLLRPLQMWQLASALTLCPATEMDLTSSTPTQLQGMVTGTFADVTPKVAGKGNCLKAPGKLPQGFRPG